MPPGNVPAAAPSVRGRRSGLPVVPRGFLVVPFLITAGVTLLIPVALNHRIDAMWAVLAIAMGSVAAALSLAWTLRRSGAPIAARTAPSLVPASSASKEDVDPLANIHVVEAQGRRHRKPCPNCGTAVRTDKEKCPSCGHLLIVDCKGCRARVRLEWGVCPECGRELP